jgi:hypothetical protein
MGEKDEKEIEQPEEGAGGDSLEEASDEAVRFMEQGDEPGHAGRGDGG